MFAMTCPVLAILAALLSIGVVVPRKPQTRSANCKSSIESRCAMIESTHIPVLSRGLAPAAMSVENSVAMRIARASQRSRTAAAGRWTKLEPSAPAHSPSPAPGAPGADSEQRLHRGACGRQTEQALFALLLGLGLDLRCQIGAEP